MTGERSPYQTGSETSMEYQSVVAMTNAPVRLVEPASAVAVAVRISRRFCGVQSSEKCRERRTAASHWRNSSVLCTCRSRGAVFWSVSGCVALSWCSPSISVHFVVVLCASASRLVAVEPLASSYQHQLHPHPPHRPYCPFPACVTPNPDCTVRMPQPQPPRATFGAQPPQHGPAPSLAAWSVPFILTTLHQPPFLHLTC
jgi:hypothetical protein